MDTESGPDVLSARTEELRAKLVAFVLREIKAGEAGPLPEQISGPLVKAVERGVRAAVSDEVRELRGAYEAALADARAGSAASQRSHALLSAELEGLRGDLRQAVQGGGEPARLGQLDRKLNEIGRLLTALAQGGGVAAIAAPEAEAEPEASGPLGMSPGLARQVGLGLLTVWALVTVMGAAAAIWLLLNHHESAPPGPPPAVAMISAGQLRASAQSASAAADVLAHAPPKGAQPALVDALTKAKASGEALRTALISAWGSANGSPDAKVAALAPALLQARGKVEVADALIGAALDDQKAHANLAGQSPADTGKSLTEAAADASATADRLEQAASDQLTAAAATPTT